WGPVKITRVGCAPSKARQWGLARAKWPRSTRRSRSSSSGACDAKKSPSSSDTTVAKPWASMKSRSRASSATANDSGTYIERCLSGGGNDLGLGRLVQCRQRGQGHPAERQPHRHRHAGERQGRGDEAHQEAHAVPGPEGLVGPLGGGYLLGG